MFKFFKRCWKYITAGANQKFNEQADPKVQLEQAITEAQDQHRRLKEQAANVIANQKQTEMRLNRAMDELEKVNAQRPPGRADGRRGHQDGRHGQGGRVHDRRPRRSPTGSSHSRSEVEELKELRLQSTQAADQAKAAVAPELGRLLQKKLAERQKLLSQLDQAKMQEQMNKAMASLRETVGQDVPTFDEVRDKIEARYAKAKGMSELTGPVGREPHARGRAGRA